MNDGLQSQYVNICETHLTLWIGNYVSVQSISMAGQPETSEPKFRQWKKFLVLFLRGVMFEFNKECRYGYITLDKQAIAAGTLLFGPELPSVPCGQ